MINNKNYDPLEQKRKNSIDETVALFGNYSLNDEENGTTEPTNNEKIIANLLFAVGYKYHLQIIASKAELNALRNTTPDTIYVQVTTDTLICSVKQLYAKKFEHIKITAEELKMSHLPTAAELNSSDVFEKILAITSKKGITNTGLVGLSPGQIVEDSDNFWSRRVLFGVLALALLLEIGFATLQFATSSVGWQAIIGVEFLAYIFAAVGTVLDFLVNVRTISPANDADVGVFAKIVTNSLLMLAMLWIVRATSLLSYLAGASGNILGVLRYMLKHSPSEAATICIYITTFLVASIGTAYYSAFNGTPTTATFSLIEKYFSAKKADNNFFRWIKIIEENLYLYGFRAGSFAAIGVQVLQALEERPKDSPVNKLEFDIAAIIFAASIVNLAATRSRNVVNYWSNNDYAFIESHERKANLTYLSSVIFTKDTLAQFAVSAGFFLLALESPSKQLAGLYYFFTGSLFLNNLIAQCDKAANQAVCEALPDGVLDKRREAYAASQTQSEKVSLLPKSSAKPDTNDLHEVERQARINAAGKAYQALSATFPQDTWDRFICTAGSTLTRGIGFTDFANTLSLLLGLQLTSLQTLGIVLVLGATNMRNMFSMFHGNMKEYGTQKEAENFVYFCKTNASASQYTLFTKPALSYDKDDIQSALIKKAEEYGYQPPTPSPV